MLCYDESIWCAYQYAASVASVGRVTATKSAVNNSVGLLQKKKKKHDLQIVNLQHVSLL